ncbi:hypothetical protein [Lewinella sp. W8]|uniref:hypothetical protein n=1 Tax=Lewinella sp. W8 TaxID=2528208 RepID=UPI0010677E20|nr:hypothetical protein [Lewinella sp. W8]MTB50311.1 hypothetical protein [Lewinella sp. W8]
MDILKAATDWAKAELVSTPFFVLAGLLFLGASIGFWQLGKTELARAYIIPTLVAGVLLVIIGTGLYFTNRARLADFPVAYERDAPAFVAAESERAAATLKEYSTIVFTAIPLIIASCALALMFLSGPNWRAALITTIAMLTVILLIDGTAYARIAAYYEQLKVAGETL